jgi:DNA mismatch repair protein MutL
VAQRLVVPLTLALGAAEAALLSHRLEDFAVAGWEIEPFGRDSFLVRAMPALVGRRNPEALLRDMVDELVHQTVARRLLVQRDHVTITNACKMAVKAGDPLEMEEMVGLLHQLADTENPYLCPHGRPVVVTMSVSELERRFKR